MDELSNSTELHDPKVLKSTVNRSSPKLTISPDDAILPGKSIHSITNRWPKNSEFSVDIHNEPLGESIPNFIPKIHITGTSSSINLPEVTVQRPLPLEVHLNHHNILYIEDSSILLQQDIEYDLVHSSPRSPRKSFLLPRDFNFDYSDFEVDSCRPRSDFEVDSCSLRSDFEVASCSPQTDISNPLSDPTQRYVPLSKSITPLFSITSTPPEQSAPTAQSTPIVYSKTVSSPFTQPSLTSPKNPSRPESTPYIISTRSQSDVSLDIVPDLQMDTSIVILDIPVSSNPSIPESTPIIFGSAKSRSDVNLDFESDLQMDTPTANPYIPVSSLTQSKFLHESSLPFIKTNKKTYSKTDTSTLNLDIHSPIHNQGKSLDEGSLPAPKDFHNDSSSEFLRNSQDKSPVEKSPCHSPNFSKKTKTNSSLS